MTDPATTQPHVPSDPTAQPAGDGRELLGRVVRIAGTVLDAPVVVASVVDGVHGDAGARIGLPPDDGTPSSALGMTPAILEAGADLAVDDLESDPRFAGRPLVPGRTLRAAAGSPLRDAAGRTVGALWVATEAPRAWTDRDRTLLRDLAAMVDEALELRLNERHFRSLTEHISDIITLVDHTGTIRYISPSVERTIGYAPRELVGRPLLDVIHPADRELTRYRLGRRLAGDETDPPKRTELRILHRDGTWRVVQARARPYTDPLGRPAAVIAARDITERKRAEEELAALYAREQKARAEAEAAQARLSTVLESIADRFFVLDHDWRFTYLNRNTEAFFRRPRSEVLGRTLWEVFPEVVGTVFEREYRRAVAEQVTVTFRTESATFPGTWLEVHAYPSEDGLSVIARDITERRRAEETLRRQALIFETVTEAVLVTDPDGRIIDWNPGAEAMFGFTRDEARGRSPAFFHHPAVGDGLREEIHHTVVREGHWAGEVPFVRKDGTAGISEAVVVAQADGAGPPIAYVAVHRDVTGKRAAETSLREREERFRALLEHSHDITVVLDRDGVITYASPSVERLLGFPPEELVGRSPVDLVHADDRDRMLRSFERRKAKVGVGRLEEFRFRDRDGRWHTLEVYGTSLFDHPAVGGLVINGRDVTERVSLEAQLRQAQRLEAIGRLAAGVAHDFNNLILSIRGYADLLKPTLGEADPRRDDLEEISGAADRAAGLARQLLAFSRRQVLQPRILDLNAAVSQIGKLLRRLIGEDVELVTRLAPDLGRVYADPGQIDQVLMNLAVNARDAMPEGGRLVIETADVVLDADEARRHQDLEPGAYVRLSVSDSGLGIDEAVRAHIFEPFFTTKESGKGTGLGLSTVYGIVKQSGGEILLDSEPGHGATFHILLPRVRGRRRDDAADARALAGGASASNAGETVLVVEDERGVRALIHKILARAGYAVLEAADADEALDAARRHETSIDLLLTDLVLPGMSGRALADRMARLRPDLRVLFMSGYAGEPPGGDRRDPADAPVLPKPFTADVLTRRVREILDSPGPAGTA